MNNDEKENAHFYKQIFKEWYFKKGFILIDFFIIIAFIQYFIFEGSFNAMLEWIKEFYINILKSE